METTAERLDPRVTGYADVNGLHMYYQPATAQLPSRSDYGKATRPMYQVNAEKLPGNEIARTFEGGRHGPSSVSFFLVHNEPGQGPELHQHPYDETFIILEGRVLVRVGDETVEGGPGDIVIGPPDVPHGFTNLGPGRARLVCIHAAPAMQTRFLE